MTKPYFLLLLGLSAIGIAQLTDAAQAQDLQTLRGADTDGDHAISIAEATSVLQQEYGRLDTNQDGSVSQDEFVNARLAQLAKLDGDGDGKITRDEIKSFFRSMRPQ
jgi:Ca2+-binding EF-hand superfamily protein